MNVDDIIDTVFSHEGGYVDDPDDPGGATNFGVSLRYAKGIGLDLDNDGDTDKDDIKLVTKEEARRLYKNDFFYEPKINTLPEPLHPQLVDFAINSGPPRAIMVLQEVINQVRNVATDLQIPMLYVDGRIGPKTRKAVETAYDAMGSYLINAIAEEREKFFYSLAEQNPRFEKYVVAKDGSIGGWIRRARSFKVKIS